ncbi:Uncharacterized protein EbC_pEb17200740 (plasmid) [Erwinia billingiae Eb661]|uniref:Uncharacterized protein n=1 Tax=Erwinia billingiae (strain Eb661) TaxID=634500 RepID=D8MJS9_ERWBE|nr:Uncharacterized protein EbC_pEb17200740 [Erwinia billingiae Eb661]
MIFSADPAAPFAQIPWPGVRVRMKKRTLPMVTGLQNAEIFFWYKF